jgi:CelD/BcsL family acetyltransferase involved in cellulose biosynthesis
LRTPFKVETIPFAHSALGSVRDEWEGLTARVNASAYLTFGWLESWATVYAPRGLVLVRITHPELGLVALGLVEELRLGMLRFAGAPITPIRGLVCDPEHEAEAWCALASWLNGRPNWTILNGVVAGACELPGAVLTPVQWFRFALPDSFEEYLASRAAGPRREFRRRLRVAEREGATTTVLADLEVASGLETFVRLHEARARAKGEVHRVIDMRLARMLARVAGHGVPELRLFAVAQRGSTVAVGVQLDHIGETWAYNTGFDPAAGRLSPGLLVRLGSIRDAIERGGRRLDLGPGDFAYKRDLGGEAYDRISVDVTPGSVAGRLMRARVRYEDRLRRRGLVRRGAVIWRRIRRARYSRMDRE